MEDQEEAPLSEAPQPDNDWNDTVEAPPEESQTRNGVCASQSADELER